jgi:dTDP-4-dehydrorhamnose reductase
VGSALTQLLGGSCLKATRQDLDLSNLNEIRPWVQRAKAKTLVNCAAYTDVDGAEAEPGKAFLVNAQAVAELATACAETETAFVTFSTDYVFDGQKRTAYVESDEPNPVNTYGASKLEGERLALKLYPKALVIRTSWVMSVTHVNFVSRMIALIREGEVNVVDDQIGSPTLAGDLACGVLDAIRASASGLLHMANRGSTSWFHLAREIAALSGLDPERVSSCSSEDFNRPATRPTNSVLASERLDTLGLRPLPDYHNGLKRVVTTLRADRAATPRVSPFEAEI